MLCTTLRADLTRGLMDCLCKALGISTVQVYSDALVEKNLGLAPGHTEQQRCVRMRACACVCVRACVRARIRVCRGRRRGTRCMLACG